MSAWRLDVEALANPPEDPYLAVGRLLRERYGPIDWRAQVAGDPKLRALLRELAEGVREVARAAANRSGSVIEQRG